MKYYIFLLFLLVCCMSSVMSEEATIGMNIPSSLHINENVTADVWINATEFDSWVIFQFQYIPKGIDSKYYCDCDMISSVQCNNVNISDIWDYSYVGSIIKNITVNIQAFSSSKLFGNNTVCTMNFSAVSYGPTTFMFETIDSIFDVESKYNKNVNIYNDGKEVNVSRGIIRFLNFTNYNRTNIMFDNRYTTVVYPYDIISFSASTINSTSINLSWNKSFDSDFVFILRNTTSFPISKPFMQYMFLNNSSSVNSCSWFDGVQALSLPRPNLTTGDFVYYGDDNYFIDTNLSPNLTYYYSIWGINTSSRWLPFIDICGGDYSICDVVSNPVDNIGFFKNYSGYLPINGTFTEYYVTAMSTTDTFDINNISPYNNETNVSIPSMFSCNINGTSGIVEFCVYNIDEYVPNWDVFYSSNWSGNSYISYQPEKNDARFLFGNSTYMWSVNVSDGLFWKNTTYFFNTIMNVHEYIEFYEFILSNISDARYDVSGDGIRVNVFDLSITWSNRWNIGDNENLYHRLYDVSQDGEINSIDMSLIWYHRNCGWL